MHSSNNGTNLKGAVIGGLIAGEAGAIIGSQHNKNTIYSTVNTIDEKYVELYYYLGKDIRMIRLDADAYPLLQNWYPDKSYDYVVSNIDDMHNEHTLSEADEIRKYKELFDDGIISQEEYENKKRQLLGL